MNALSRAYTSDLEIRADGDGRTIQGIVVPYGQTARVSDGGPSYTEKFQRGAFANYLNKKPIDRWPMRLLSQHKTDMPIGRATDLRETDAGLFGAFRVSDTTAGRDQLELVRDGVLGAFSVGFTPMQATKDGPTTIRTEVALREVSLVTFPAYEGAIVTGIRALAPDEQLLAQQLLNVLAIADVKLDPFVDALCAADGALEAAQAIVSQILMVPNPDENDCTDGCDCECCAADPAADPADPAAPMQMSSALTSLARRLDVAFAARATAPSTEVGTDGSLTPPGRLVIARNNLRACLIERGIK